MNLITEARAGTLESGDLKVKVLPACGELEIVISSEVMQQFGDQIRHVCEQTLQSLEVYEGVIIVEDKGALDCVIRARLQCAVLRSAGISLPDMEALK